VRAFFEHFRVWLVHTSKSAPIGFAGNTAFGGDRAEALNPISKPGIRRRAAAQTD
jgi:hypothetical protein